MMLVVDSDDEIFYRRVLLLLALWHCILQKVHCCKRCTDRLQDIDDYSTNSTVQYSTRCAYLNYNISASLNQIKILCKFKGSIFLAFSRHSSIPAFYLRTIQYSSLIIAFFLLLRIGCG